MVEGWVGGEGRLWEVTGWKAGAVVRRWRGGSSAAAGGGWDDGSIRGILGKPWTFVNPGVSIKPHPSGSLTHPGMTKMLELIKATDIPGFIASADGQWPALRQK